MDHNDDVLAFKARQILHEGATAFVNVNVGATRLFRPLSLSLSLVPSTRAAHSAAKFQFQASIFKV